MKRLRQAKPSGAGTSGRRMALCNDHGSSLVELALCMPFLLLLLVGIADFGWIAYSYIELGNATNAGAQYAAQSTTYAAPNNQPAISAAVNNDAANLSGITTTVTNTCTCSDGSAVSSCLNAATTCTGTARIITNVTVTTSMPISPFISWTGIPTSITLHGQATMRVEE
ncbi:TadE/TadG family type IV pilus assembly protein [Edaphobacter bradus]|uniref:TadE/TadG family type IV pilus assembly protein n=1 Tax=Edaphobacter bradus TaxID=2259016 RepID=UPI0021E0E6D5|nr:TadE family protein [Edaphobacter bradus]